MDRVILLAIGLVFAGLMGYLAQSVRMCMVRGVNEGRAGRPTLMLAILFSGVWLWIAILIADRADVELTLHRYMPNTLFALGGFVFGIGCAMNRSCGLSTISRLARGDIHMLATLLGWYLGWNAWLTMSEGNQATLLSSPPTIVTVLLMAVSLSLSIWALSRPATPRKIWLHTLAFGFLGALLLLIEQRWFPIAIAVDSGYLVSGQSIPVPALVHRIALLATLMLGMTIAAWHMGRFRWHRLHVWQLGRNLVSGLIMGVGASMALGGNLLQILVATPAASPAGLLTVATMLLGVWFGLAVSDIATFGGNVKR